MFMFLSIIKGVCGLVVLRDDHAYNTDGLLSAAPATFALHVFRSKTELQCRNRGE